MSSQRLRGVVLWTRPQPQVWEVEAVTGLRALADVELVGALHLPQPARAVSLLERVIFRPRSTRRAELPALPGWTPAGDLDFVLQLGPDAPREQLPTARWGTWAFRPDDAGLQQLATGAAVHSAALVRRDDGQVLRQGQLKPLRHSPARSADQLVQEMARWPADVCRRLLAGSSLTEAATLPPDDTAPLSAMQACGLLARTGWNFSSNFFETLFLDAEWNIGVIEQPVQRFLDPTFAPEVSWLPGPERGRFAADSFIVEWHGRRFLFFEDLDFRSYKGRIWAVELNGAQPLGAPVTVFDPPHHLSYPYLLEHQGELYMIPEAAAVQEVALYRAVELPARWEKVATLLQGVPAIDTSVFVHEGRWWMLATQPDALGDPNSHLYLWHAPELLGPWQPHPCNPVKIDVRSARPAGPPFVSEGQLYRPAQDCSATYGGRLVLLRIERLTPTDFAEQVVRVLDPLPESRYPGGLHTLSGWGKVSVLDGKRTIFNRHAFGHALRRKFGRLFAKLTRRRRD